MLPTPQHRSKPLRCPLLSQRPGSLLPQPSSSPAPRPAPWAPAMSPVAGGTALIPAGDTRRGCAGQSSAHSSLTAAGARHRAPRTPTPRARRVWDRRLRTEPRHRGGDAGAGTRGRGHGTGTEPRPGQGRAGQRDRGRWGRGQPLGLGLGLGPGPGPSGAERGGSGRGGRGPYRLRALPGSRPSPPS